MTTAPVVTVVLIFLNEERYLTEAVDSVRGQTYDAWELLLCDDGSTDRSADLARRWAAEDARIRYLEHPGHRNRGMSATRNLGVRAARGRYIALLDADDTWLPSKLADQVAILDAHPQVAMVAGASEYWRSWAGGPDRIVPIGAPADAVAAPPSLITLLYPLGAGAAPCPSDLLLRRDAIEAVGGFENSFRGFYEDQAFLAKLYLRYEIWIDSACLSRYRQRADSCVATISGRAKIRTRQRFLRYLKKHLKESAIQHPTIDAALDAARWQLTWRRRSLVLVKSYLIKWFGRSRR